MDLTDIYRSFYPNTKEYTFFSHFMELSPKVTTHLDTKQISSNIKNVKITPCILSDYHESMVDIKLDMNNRISRKLTNLWKLNNSLLNENWVKTEIKKEVKDSPEFNSMDI